MKKKRLVDYLFKIKKWILPEQEELSNIESQNSDLYERVKNKEKYEVKMIHQYPKEGAFRSTYITDEMKQSPKVAEKEAYKEHHIEYTRKPKEKFKGRHFVAQKIPSPVFGYQTEKVVKPIEEIQKAETKVAPHVERSIQTASNKQSDATRQHASKEKLVRDKLNDDKKRIKGDEGSKRSNEEKKSIRPNDKKEREMVTKENLVYNPQLDATIREKQTKNQENTNVKRGTIPFNVLMNPNHKGRLNKVNHVNKMEYKFPPLKLLNIYTRKTSEDQSWLDEKTKHLNETFDYFQIRAKVVHVTKGPTVTRFEVHPEPGVKVSKIVSLTDDLKLNLAAREIRIEAPIPGKNTVGIEVPNDVAEPVYIRQILDHPSFQNSRSPLTVAMGMGISGEPVVTDLQKMPHGLIAGSTGSGKSVCVNSILTSILYKATPQEVRLLLIDPKMVELASFNEVPHLAAPVITDPKEATEGLKWAVTEMERRYQCFAKAGAKDISRYNKKMTEIGQQDQLLPYLLIVVDELADLMMVSPHDVEDSICRIAQKARACGIHLLVATQRPSVDVITGLIKANIPTRIAFSVSSQADSRTILDGVGAERLLGKGDMLLMETGSSKPIRIQGNFVSDDEIDRVVEYVKRSPRPHFLFEREKLKNQIAKEAEDDLFDEACAFILVQQSASASLLQRRFHIGYNRAARLIDEMEVQGLVSPARGSKAREVYLTNHDQKEENS